MMKDLISAVAFVVAIFWGTVTLKRIHNVVVRYALEKAAQGLPSLVEMNEKLRHQP